MALNVILHRTASLLGVSDENVKIPPQDGEVIYCKNNVCVHPPNPLCFQTDHHPGYLTIKNKIDDVLGSTLILTWIPNSMLKRNPHFIDSNSPLSSPCHTSRSSSCLSLCSSFRHSLLSVGSNDYSHSNNCSPQHCRSLKCSSVDLSTVFSSYDSKELLRKQRFSLSISEGDRSQDISRNKDVITKDLASEIPSFEAKVENLNYASDAENNMNDLVNMTNNLDLKRHVSGEGDTQQEEISNRIISSQNEKDEENQDRSAVFSVDYETPKPTQEKKLTLSYKYMEETPETFALAHNLLFPRSSIPSSAPLFNSKDLECDIFSIDLGHMRSLRMFFSNSECTSGQLVIASRESQYKILHFHHGGLNKLASVFEEWNVLGRMKNNNDCPYRQFFVCRPELRKSECHPEEGMHEMVTEEIWKGCFNDNGQLENDYHIRKAIFFGGLDPLIRPDVWPFLLHYFLYSSTYDEREECRFNSLLEYNKINEKRLSMSVEEREIFWKNIESIIEKDVVRTDRSNPFFTGDKNANTDVMKNILLNYAVYNPSIGYTQGMSDMLAPLLCVIQSEVDTFWCFEGIIQRTTFFTSPSDADMDKNLSYLRELIRVLLPRFYKHLEQKLGGLELLFAHRWILLCFKREFSEHDVLNIWEACWANYQTDYFHLFLSVAVIAIYGDDVVEQNLPSDEMLLYFTSLAMHMSGETVLRKARGLLYLYRQLPSIPCTLAGLSELCGRGMWDSGHIPTIICVSNHENKSCPHGGQDDVAVKKK